MVAMILFGAMFFTRKKEFAILSKRDRYSSYLDEPHPSPSSEDLLSLHDVEDEDGSVSTSEKYPCKQRRWCGLKIQTPNTFRFRNNVHSRILQKFPFLIEMFYWVINYAFYRMTAIASQRLFAGVGIWNVAQAHGVAVLEFEQFGWLSFLFPVREVSVQRWFMDGHQVPLTFLNRIYALIHIPGTVGFIAWYYYAAPSHPIFAVVRRTLTLTNFLAFLTFVVYPCMPPRLLPAEYGFLDTVRHDNAQSVWMSGKYVNTLAAMPSMHFGYSFAIGCTLVYHSTAFRSKRSLEVGELRKPAFWKAFYVLLGLLYPATILTTIVATANHYWLDATVAACFVLFSFLANWVFFVFVPLEDLLLWAIRAEKPLPTTGERFRCVRGR